MNSRRLPRARTLVSIAAAAAAIGATSAPLAAQAAPDARYSSSGRILITSIDDRYLIAAHKVRAGLVTITFSDHGSSPHQAQLFLLNPGISYARFKSDLLGNKPSAIGPDALPWGGAAVTAPHHDQVIYQPLQGGTYAVVCFVSTPAGVPHFVSVIPGVLEVPGASFPGDF